MSTLQAAWVSRASEKQRRGRAGRCQPGVALHCYSRTRSQALAELQLPELKRSPLDELCLQVYCLRCFCFHPSLPCPFTVCATQVSQKFTARNRQIVNITSSYWTIRSVHDTHARSYIAAHEGNELPATSFVCGTAQPWRDGSCSRWRFHDHSFCIMKA